MIVFISSSSHDANRSIKFFLFAFFCIFLSVEDYFLSLLNLSVDSTIDDERGSHLSITRRKRYGHVIK